VLISAPFTQDGAGTFYWQASNLGAYINSWNLSNLTVNGVNLTNLYVAAASLPAKINGYW
jgi:type V secretory pathway adhesin AidA